MSKKRIPVSALRQLAQQQGQDVAVLLTYDSSSGYSHVVTWGRTVEQCSKAADTGNKLKIMLGWPDDLQAQPARVKALERERDELRRVLRNLVDSYDAGGLDALRYLEARKEARALLAGDAAARGEKG